LYTFLRGRNERVQVFLPEDSYSQMDLDCRDSGSEEVFPLKLLNLFSLFVSAQLNTSEGINPILVNGFSAIYNPSYVLVLTLHRKNIFKSLFVERDHKRNISINPLHPVMKWSLSRLD